MSSGDERIDITNDLDPPENPKHYITEMNISDSELAQEYVLYLFYFVMLYSGLHTIY